MFVLWLTACSRHWAAPRNLTRSYELLQPVTGSYSLLQLLTGHYRSLQDLTSIFRPKHFYRKRFRICAHAPARFFQKTGTGHSGLGTGESVPGNLELGNQRKKRPTFDLRASNLPLSAIHLSNSFSIVNSQLTMVNQRLAQLSRFTITAVLPHRRAQRMQSRSSAPLQLPAALATRENGFFL